MITEGWKEILYLMEASHVRVTAINNPPLVKYTS